MEITFARELVSRITRDDDGAHAVDLLILINGITEPENVIAGVVKRQLYEMTPDFQSHFREYISQLAA